MHIMYRFLFTVIAVLGAAGMAGQTVVVDSEDGGVIAGASFFFDLGCRGGYFGQRRTCAGTCDEVISRHRAQSRL